MCIHTLVFGGQNNVVLEDAIHHSFGWQWFVLFCLLRSCLSLAWNLLIQLDWLDSQPQRFACLHLPSTEITWCTTILVVWGSNLGLYSCTVHTSSLGSDFNKEIHIFVEMARPEG